MAKLSATQREVLEKLRNDRNARLISGSWVLLVGPNIPTEYIHRHTYHSLWDKGLIKKITYINEYTISAAGRRMLEGRK